MIHVAHDWDVSRFYRPRDRLYVGQVGGRKVITNDALAAQAEFIGFVHQVPTKRSPRLLWRTHDAH